MFVKPGDPIPLSLQLYDGHTGKHCIAFLYDSNDIELGASPVNLAHLENGLYLNDSVAMPYNINHVKAVYRVFDDIGHTMVSEYHSDAIDVFEIGDLTATGIAPTEVDGIVDGSEMVTGEIEAKEVTGEIELGSELVAEVEAVETTGEAEEANAEGSTDHGEIEGEVKC